VPQASEQEFSVKRTLRCLLILITVVCAGVAQEISPAVIHGDCTNELPQYQQWYQATKLAYGEPYSVPTKRKEQVFGNYPKLNVGMSLEEVERLLGKPDFSAPLPPARLASTPAPIGQRCSDQVAYILNKTSENMSDMEDVAIYLFFSRDGKLYWAAPQNLPTLKGLGSPTEPDPSALKSTKPVDISVVAASGAVSGNRYTNSFFKLSVSSSNATFQLNPLVNTADHRARLVQLLAKPTNWEDTYTFAVLADCLTEYPQLESLTQYVRSVRHQLEKEGLSTVREEFPISIGGTQFAGAILEEHVPAGRKYYRGMYSTFRNGYILSFDVEAASEDKLNELVARAVKFTN
jgi:hypothetical protein